MFEKCFMIIGDFNLVFYELTVPFFFPFFKLNLLVKALSIIKKMIPLFVTEVAASLLTLLFAFCCFF